jgi:hypothetical protein
LINDPSIGEFGTVLLISKRLRVLGWKFSMAWINDPAVVEADKPSLIMNGLRILHLQTRWFRSTIPPSLNNSRPFTFLNNTTSSKQRETRIVFRVLAGILSVFFC